MTYQETLEYLYSRLPMYQREGKSAYKKDLTNTLLLLNELGNPHKNTKMVHIAGTNGKGTSAHSIAAILQTAGYKTGLYTSPHLKSFTERIRIDGKEVEEQFVIDFIKRIRHAIEQINPSFFEITVAMAFEYFSDQEVDIAIIETGLGGRLDSTNVILPEVCLITNIGYDHTDLLGDTLAKIAYEKAGIIKHGVPVIIGETTDETRPVFEARAKDLQAELIFAPKVGLKKKSNYVPDYLVLNYPGILATIQELSKKGWEIKESDITNGIEKVNEKTGLKGRMQIVEKDPLVIADVSHNKEGLKILFDQISEMNQGNLHLIFGTVKDKDLAPIFQLLPSQSAIYWTQSNVPRSLNVEELAIQGIVRGLQGECYKNVNDAINAAKEKAKPSDLILITGSTFVVAEIDNL